MHMKKQGFVLKGEQLLIGQKTKTNQKKKKRKKKKNNSVEKSKLEKDF